MTIGDRITAVSLVVALGLFLNLTINGRMDSVNVALAAYEERFDSADRQLQAADRQVREVHALFLGWLAMLVLPWLRPPDRAWHDSLRLAACAYAALPVLNALTTDQHLGVTLPAGAWALAGFDLVSLATGLGFGVAAVVLRRQEVAVAAAEPLPDSDGMPAVSAATPIPEDAAG